jgi:Domain of unknown function (DUF6745)
MRAISASRRAVREALAHEGWRFALVGSLEELRRHRDSCRTLTLPVGNESDNRSQTIREELLAQLPWEVRGQPFPRWLSYISKSARKRLQPNLPLAAEFCLIHGFIFLIGNVWAERQGARWRPHCANGPAVVFDDRELYFWRGWQVSKATLMQEPTAERILKETNQTEREVLIQRMGVENFVRETELKEVDSYRESTLFKVNTAETRGRYRSSGWTEDPLALAFLKVICPSTEKAYFLRVDPDAETAKQALESTLPRYSRDWERDLVEET